VSEHGKYRIQTVAQMTGVPPTTLRAWQRRYGIPQPSRSASEYRLYSEADIELLRTFIHHRENNITASEAARLAREVSETTETDNSQQAPTVDEERAERTVQEPSANADLYQENYQEVCKRLVDAVLDFNPALLEAEVQRLFLLGSAFDIFDHVISPTMHTIGQLWHQGKCSVAQEHMASLLLEDTASQLLRLVQPSYDAPVVLAACLNSELHTLPLYGVSFRFASHGFRVIPLGAQTPPEAIRDGVQRLKPQLVALSCTIPPPHREVTDLLTAYAQACQNVPWIVGGQGSQSLEALVRALGGCCGDHDLGLLVNQIRQDFFAKSAE
jgi:MerR family transcriptional regulator, light-induced transcriptional regulator